MPDRSLPQPGDDALGGGDSAAKPVSWYAIEHGWSVASVDGDSVGTVTEVLGDEQLDIFNGILISRGLGRAGRYVPAEQIRVIEEGQVVVSVPSDEDGGLLPASAAPYAS